MKNTAVNTINATYELREMGRLDLIPSNIQQLSRILIGFISYYGIHTNIQDAGNMNSLQHILDRINCETSRLFKSLMTDRVNIKMWTIALTISHILYLIPIFCFAAQTIITQDSIAIRHYWWCKLFCYSSLWPFSLIFKSLSHWSLHEHAIMANGVVGRGYHWSVYSCFINVHDVSVPMKAKAKRISINQR